MRWSRARTVSSRTRYSARRRPVALDALPDALQARGLARAEVVGGVGDRAREAEHIHLALRQPALLAQLAHQLVPVELLHGLDEGGGVDAVDVDDLPFHAPLDGRGQGIHGLGRIVAVRVGMGLTAMAGPKETSTRPRNDLRASKVRPTGTSASAPRPLRLVGEGDAGRARLDPLHPGLRVRRALGVDGDHAARVEGGVAGGEGVRVAIHLVRVVLPPVHGDGSCRVQEARHERIAKQRGGGHVVHLAREHGRHDQRVDEVVGMVAAEEHGAAGGHALEVAHVDALEEEPQPEAPDGADDAVEAIDRLGGRPTPLRRGERGSTRGRGLAGHHAPLPDIGYHGGRDRARPHRSTCPPW